MDEREAVLRELAQRPPIIDSDLGDYCWVCGKVAGATTDLGQHELRCLWRRAAARFPN